MRRSASVDERTRQGLDLARKQQRELVALAARQESELAEVKRRHVEEVRQLQQAHVRQTVDLWQQQGRTLEPWTAPVLEGRLPKGHPRPGKVLL